jgi:Immunity protein 32
MISIEIRDAEKLGDGLSEVEIYCDLEGLKELMRHLRFLENGESHIHLATPSWAGNELGEKVIGKGNVIVNQLKIAIIPKR